MEHLPDVPNPTRLVPLVNRVVPSRTEAQVFLVQERYDWVANVTLAALKAQRYLYFGLLTCFTHCEIDTQEYVTLPERPGQKEYLNSYNNLRLLRPENLRRPPDEEALASLRGAIRHTGILFESFPLSRGEVLSDTQIEHNQIHLVCLSVRLLIEHIKMSLSLLGGYYISRWERRREQIKYPLLWFDLYSKWQSLLPLYPPGAQGSVLLQNHFQGWCPSVTGTIFNTMTWSTCTFFSRLRQPGIMHSRVDNSISLDSCTYERCAYQVNETTYQVKHTVDDCYCDFLSMPEEGKHIVRRGGIALVRLVYDHNGVPSLSVEEAHSGSRYIAISHVWSGGLGNPKGNALPLCQLRKLAADLEDVNVALHRNILLFPGKPTRKSCGLFWMDTLCIPVHDEADRPESGQDLRRLAIGNMQATYVRAEAVMVIDPSLQELDGQLPRNELYAYIYASAWMSRCWTFEEASMAADVFVILNKQPYRLDMGRRGRSQDTRKGDLSQQLKPTSLSDIIYDDLVGWIGELPLPGYNTTQDDPVFFRYIYNTLVKRGASHESDRLTILSTMLNFRPLELNRLPRDQRLASIVASSECLPNEILFMDHEPDKPPGQSRSWMPLQKMIRPIIQASQGHDLHRQTNGVWQFIVDKKQCLFKVPSHQLRSGRILVSLRQNIYTLVLQYADSQIRETPTAFSIQSNSMMEDGCDTECILLVRDRQMLWNTLNATRSTALCALFEVKFTSIQESVEQPWILSYITPLKCSLISRESPPKPGVSITRNELETDSEEPITINLLVPDCQLGRPLLPVHRATGPLPILGYVTEAYYIGFILTIGYWISYTLLSFVPLIVLIARNVDYGGPLICTPFYGLVRFTACLFYYSSSSLPMRRAVDYWSYGIRATPIEASTTYWIHAPINLIKIRMCVAVIALILGVVFRTSAWAAWVGLCGCAELGSLGWSWLVELICGRYDWHATRPSNAEVLPPDSTEMLPLEYTSVTEPAQASEDIAWQDFFRASWLTQLCFGTSRPNRSLVHLLTKKRTRWAGYVICLVYQLLNIAIPVAAITIKQWST